jgi:hypothetical protein
MSESAIPDVDPLTARLQELEAENARLRAEALTVPAKAPRPREGGRWRAVVSAICIVVASILVPVSIVAAWARVELVDETRFVETFAPLADDPHVQAMVIDQTTTAIQESLDLDSLANDQFDGLQQLDLPPRALAAIDLLRAPAVQGLTNLVDATVTRLVESDAFADVWETALRASHRALQAAAAGQTAGGAVVIGDDGTLGIELGPIVEEVKQRLVDRGIAFAASIPPVQRTIVVAQSDALALVGGVYNLAVAAGWWTPVVTLVLFVLGILIARHRSTAFLGAGIGLALGGGVLAAALGIGGSVLSLSAPSLGVPSGALNAVYAQVTDAMQHTAVIAMLVGVVIAVIAWFLGRSRGARAARASMDSVNDGLRSAIAERGVDTGATGDWLYGQRVLVRVVLGVLAVVWLLLLRPLSAGDIFLVLIVWLIVWWLVELAQRRPIDEDTDAEPLVTGDAPVAGEAPVVDDSLVATPATAAATPDSPDALVGGEGPEESEVVEGGKR